MDPRDQIRRGEIVTRAFAAHGTNRMLSYMPTLDNEARELPRFTEAERAKLAAGWTLSLDYSSGERRLVPPTAQRVPSGVPSSTWRRLEEMERKVAAKPSPTTSIPPELRQRPGEKVIDFAHRLSRIEVDPYRMAARLGLKVRDLLPTDGRWLGVYEKKRREIRLDYTKPRWQQRETLAHELGHFFGFDEPDADLFMKVYHRYSQKPLTA